VKGSGVLEEEERERAREGKREREGKSGRERGRNV
jgi:hypothetical protein